MKYGLHVIALFFFCLPVRSQLTWDWSRSVCSTTLGYYIVACDVKTDPQGNALLLGYDDRLPGASSMIPDSGSFVAKFNTYGSVMWSKRIKGRVIAFDVDYAGNTFVTGTYSTGTSIYGNGQAIFVEKIGPSGTLIWQKSFAGSNSVVGDIACSASGELVICGALGSAGLQVDSLLLQDTHALFILKLNGNGSVLWNRTGSAFPKKAGSDIHRRGEVITFDGSGNVIVAYETEVICGYYCQYLNLTILDKNGKLLKNHRISDDFDQAFALVTDHDDAVYFVHEINGGTSSGDHVITKWSAGLQSQLWQKNIGGYMAPFELASKPAINNDGTLFLAGSIGYWQSSTVYTTNINGQTYSNKGETDICVCRLSTATGSIISCKTAAGLRREWGSAISTDGNGNAYVTGHMNQADYDNTIQDTVCFDQNCLAMQNLTPFQFLARLNFEPVKVSIKEDIIPTLFNVYPNPVTDRLFINPNSNDVYHLKIYSQSGVLIQEAECYGQTQVALSQPGLYLIEVKMGTAREIKKVWMQ